MLINYIKIVFVVLTVGFGITSLPCTVWSNSVKGDKGEKFTDDEIRYKLEKFTEDVLDVFYLKENEKLTTTEKRVLIRSILVESYDPTIILRRAMGRNWKLLDDIQQEEIKGLFTLLLIKTAYDSLSDTNKDKPEIIYGKTNYITNKRAELSSIIKYDGNVYNVVYRFGKMKSGWEIYDVVGENISFVSNYRQQFDDFLRTGSPQDLIQKVKELLSDKVT